ncbi:unnamed protein product [Withania somnifera]
MLFKLIFITQSQIFNGKAPESLNAEGKLIESGMIAELALSNSALNDETASEWIKKDKIRMFYRKCLGMKLLRKQDIPEEGYSNAFLGYGPEESNFAVELTYNHGVDKYDIGTGFGHFGIAVEDVAKAVDLAKAKGRKIVHKPGSIKDGGPIIALMEDPDGYSFELLERGPTLEPFHQVMLRKFGRELLRKRYNLDNKNTIAIMGYGPEDKNAVLQLTYIYGVKGYDKGNGYAQVFVDYADFMKELE